MTFIFGNNNVYWNKHSWYWYFIKKFLLNNKLRNTFLLLKKFDSECVLYSLSKVGVSKGGLWTITYNM